MSRELIVRCSVCVARAIQYTDGETDLEVSADLKRRGWCKDRKNNDLCPYCVKTRLEVL